MNERGVSAAAESLSAVRAANGDDEGRATGRMLGKYRLIAELGSGGMATVYLAVARGPSGFSKLVVLKVLRSNLAQDPDVVSMFMDEARLAARLNHANVVQTNEVSEEGGHHLLVMEYLDGVTLNELLERTRRSGKPLPASMHLRIIHEALNGLHYAHELTDFDGKPLHLVHRDISPHNVFVTFDGQVKVLDFGIAKVATSSHDTRTGVIKGKIRYMSPEQIAGDSLDRRADLFAVGAMLWEVATGERLWRGKSDVEIMSRVVNGSVPAPMDVNPEADGALDRICRKALAANADDRYSNSLELQAEIEELLESRSDRSNPRAIGRFVSEAFEDTRQDRKKMIEAQLSAANNGTPAENFSMSGVPNLPGYSSGSHSVDRAARSDSGSASRNLGIGVPAPQERPSNGRRLAFVAALGVAAIAGALVLPRLFARELPAPVQTPAATATSAAPVATPAPTTAPTPAAVAPADTTLTLTLSAEPASAVLFFDGAPLASNPFKYKVVRDGTNHVVRAEATGFVTKTVSVTSDADRELVLTLDKAPIGWVAKPGQKAPAVTATVTAQPTPSVPATSEAKPATSATGKKPPKAIDTVNPWD